MSATSTGPRQHAGRLQIGVAGAGFSGAVVARQLAEAGHRVSVFDPLPHVAGHCHTERDAETGVMVHRYGPHIFHTADVRVWEYVRRFADMVPYRHTVRTTVAGRVYPMPVNLTTINLLFGTELDPAGARALVEAQRESFTRPPVNFEEQALATVGRRLYEAFFRGYTAKQWGADPVDLPPSLFSRLPVRFTADDSYFDHPYQAIPRGGYTALVTALLDHPAVDVHLGHAYTPTLAEQFDHSIWTGPIDAWFGHSLGRLRYRTLDFEAERGEGVHQMCAVMNFGDRSVAHTRITEFKHFAAWEQHERSVWYREYSREAGPDDAPYYPVRLAGDEHLLDAYLELARASSGVTFVGRLATYKYIDMDVAIGAALQAAATIVTAIDTGRPIPPFTGTP